MGRRGVLLPNPRESLSRAQRKMDESREKIGYIEETVSDSAAAVSSSPL